MRRFCSFVGGGGALSFTNLVPDLSLRRVSHGYGPETDEEFKSRHLLPVLEPLPLHHIIIFHRFRSRQHGRTSAFQGRKGGWETIHDYNLSRLPQSAHWKVLYPRGISGLLIFYIWLPNASCFSIDHDFGMKHGQAKLYGLKKFEDVDLAW